MYIHAHAYIHNAHIHTYTYTHTHTHTHITHTHIHTSHITKRMYLYTLYKTNLYKLLRALQSSSWHLLSVEWSFRNSMFMCSQWNGHINDCFHKRLHCVEYTHHAEHHSQNTQQLSYKTLFMVKLGSIKIAIGTHIHIHTHTYVCWEQCMFKCWALNMSLTKVCRRVRLPFISKLNLLFV